MLSSILQQKFHFRGPWKRQKTKGSLMFSGGKEIEHLLQITENHWNKWEQRHKMGWKICM